MNIPKGCTLLTDHTVIDQDFYIVGWIRNERFEPAATRSHHPAWRKMKANKEATRLHNESSARSAPATSDEILAMFGFWPDGDEDIVEGAYTVIR